MKVPELRRGEPSPLVLHLAAALSGYMQALMAAPRASEPSFPWVEHLAEQAAGLDDLDQIAVATEIAARLAATLRGIEAWQAHPYRRDVAEPPEIWRAGGTRLLDYGQTPEATDPEGPPVLVVPSLINRAYVLDLGPPWSMLRALAAEGLRPALLDWGAPGREEAAFTLDDYGRLRLAPALAALRETCGRPAALMGYCMGGTLAAGLAARAPDGISALSTVGAPWDFSSTRGVAGGLRAMMRAGGAERIERQVDAVGAAFGLAPVQLFQTLFALVNPMQAALKFRKFGRLDPASPAARHFVAIEDWLADGMPMAAPAAKDLLVGWQIQNETARRAWRFVGDVVDPGEIRAPTICFCGARDSIAPPSLSLALPAAIPGAVAVQPRTGHVGMVVGGSAPAQVWRPMAEFLRTHAG